MLSLTHRLVLTVHPTSHASVHPRTHPRIHIHPTPMIHLILHHPGLFSQTLATVLPAARRLNLPGALHEHVARPCCASQSDRPTPRPSSLSRLELLPAAAPSECLRAPVSPKNPLRRPSPSCLSCLYHLLAHRITAAHQHYYFYYCSNKRSSFTAVVA